MHANVATDLRELQDRLEAAERDAKALVAGLSEEQGILRGQSGGWSVAQCLDHLATGNRVYLGAMQEAAKRARVRGRYRRRPARPGWVGRIFVWMFGPRVPRWFRLRAPRSIRPRAQASLAETLASFLAAQADVRAFILAEADLDLAGTRFRNPFVPGFRFSLATGLHIITAHEIRHLEQAWRVRRAIELELDDRPISAIRAHARED